MRHIIPLLTFALLLTGLASGARSADVQSTAVGDVSIRAEPGSPFRNPSSVRLILTTKTLLKQAVNKVSQAAGTSPDISDVAKLELEVEPNGLIRATVNSYDDRVPADQLLQQLAVALQEALRERDVAPDDNELRARLQQQNVDRIANELAKEHDELVNLAAEFGVSPHAELSAQQQMRLAADRQSLGVQLHGLKARQEILEQQTARWAEKVVEGKGADPTVLKELMKSVEARKKIVEYRQAGYNVASETLGDLEQAKDELAKAQFELAKYRRAAADKAGGWRIAELKARLDSTAVEMAEIDARRDALATLLDKMLAVSGPIDMKRLEVERLKREYAAASAELDRLRTKLRLHIAPRVRIVPTE